MKIAAVRIWLFVFLLSAGVLSVLYSVPALFEGASLLVRDLPDRNKRRALFRELQPIVLENCGMKRFGVDYDGGYLLCADLLEDVAVAYSYGIDGRDSWGCDVSRAYDVTVHQYDCFNTERPSCPGARLEFHAECLGAGRETLDGREFDSLANQIASNGDSNERLLVKIDIEAAEWDALLATPESLLSSIDQLVIEFHHVNQDKYLEVVRRMKRHFHIANLHFNNNSCERHIQPFPAWAYEVLFVNKRLVEVDEAVARASVPHPLDRPNAGYLDDCQPSSLTW